VSLSSLINQLFPFPAWRQAGLPVYQEGLSLKPDPLKKMKKSRQKALTLMEILVSLVVLALVFLGLLNLFISGRKYLQHSQSRMVGSEFGKASLDPLQMEVRQDTWASNSLGISTPVITSQVIDGLTYTATSTVSLVGTTDLRRVQTKISWEENK
jgi:Tfp pilus assembly protein PilV